MEARHFASLMSERCATRTTSCASAAWSMGSAAASSRARSSSRASSLRGRCWRRSQSARSVRTAAPCGCRDRCAGARPPAPASLRRDRALDGVIDRGAECRRHAARLRQLLANDECLGHPQQIARRQLAGDQAAAARRSIAPASACAIPRSARSAARRSAAAAATPKSRRGRGRGVLDERAQPRLDVGDRRRQPQLHVEEAMVHRTNGHADRAASSSRVRDANPVMRDHRELSAFCVVGTALSSRESVLDSSSCSW